MKTKITRKDIQKAMKEYLESGGIITKLTCDYESEIATHNDYNYHNEFFLVESRYIQDMR